MTRWGRLSCLVAVGLFIGAGCGGRTDALSNGYDPDGSGADGVGADGSGADGNGAGPSQGGTPGNGGRPARAGSPGVGGTISVSGGYPGGGYPGGGYPGGGYPGGAPAGGYGGYYGYGGVYAFGGAYVGGAGGYGYAGYAGYPVAGTGYGGNPMQPGGACCEARMTASCRPRAVANCVCRSVPYCCDTQWDEKCAALVEPLGCGYCENEPVDCQSCLNDFCGSQLQQCFADFGCVSIFSCVQNTGCQAFQCYTNGQCREVIDTWGGPGGYSMGLLLESFSCAIQSGCPCN